MWELFGSVLAVFAGDVVASVPTLSVLAAIYTVLGLLAASCNEGRGWWRKPDLATDLGYLVVMPGLLHYGRIVLMMLGIVLFHRVQDPDQVAAILDGGHGPLATLPFALQIVVYLVASDLFMYATHRLFHDMRFWRFHAVHHSSEHLEWISAHRVHPIDVLVHVVAGDCLLLLAGISPEVLVWVVPFNIGMATLVHANLNWTFGPFRYVLASPVFHRWHHTGVDRGGERNFAANFPVIDLLFGTFYMPPGRLPDDYGVTERDVPYDLGRQMLHPFRRPAD